MRFARWTFAIAGVYGLVTLIPHYFLEAFIGRNHPPAITHPEFYYGFVGVALSFQILFLLIARDPVRLRPAMLAAIVEKASFVIAVGSLLMAGRVAAIMAVPAGIDLVLATLFVVAYMRTPEAQKS